MKKLLYSISEKLSKIPDYVIIMIYSILIGLLILLLATSSYSLELMMYYTMNLKVFFLNIAPIFFVMYFSYLIFKRLWISCLISGIPLILAVINYYKISFRNDPLFIEDFLIIKEAASMGFKKYPLFIDGKLLFVGVTYIVLVVLSVTYHGRIHIKKRVWQFMIMCVTGFFLFKLETNTFIYSSIKMHYSLNEYNATEKYVSRGFLYPMIYSVNYYIDENPVGYNKGKTENLLNQYSNEMIADDKKVNIIAIMREAYVDFSQFDVEGLDCDNYQIWHELIDESYNGILITNIFAGGTVETERSFLTGNYTNRNYRSNTNSYVWYLKSQGYTVEGSHPFYKWFYNRQNVNQYLGFENYRYYEDDYEYLTDAYYPEDKYLMKEIYSDLICNINKNNNPYFSFNVTVQSHGPYGTTYNISDKEYLTGSYSAETKNAMNNYMYTINECDKALKNLVEWLRNLDEPIILLVFSDHMPWMGNDNEFYKEMGIDLDLSGETGFKNYYSTEYLIWANEEAKQVLNSEFIGVGPTISPCFLMNVLFEQCGWRGPSFMQAMTNIMKTIPVITTHDRYVIEGSLEKNIPEMYEGIVDEFYNLQYYWRHNFLY